MDDTWKEYFENTKNNKARPNLVKALSFVKDREQVLELGAGALTDSVFLLKEGFTMITAVDKEPIAQKVANMLPKEHFSYVISTFESLEYPENKFDLINAQFSLPFIHPEVFTEVFKKIVGSLKKEGVFVGHLYGKNDEWALSEKSMTFHTVDEVRELLSGLEIIDFQEKEWDKPTAEGSMKHWHTFLFIVRK